MLFFWAPWACTPARSGTIYFDDFESHRFSYIGTLADPGTHNPGLFQYTFTSQPNGTEGNNFWINSAALYNGTNYGSGTYFSVGESINAAGLMRGLMKFDLSSIPASAMITSAKLYLTVTGDSANNTAHDAPIPLETELDREPDDLGYLCHWA